MTYEAYQKKLLLHARLRTVLLSVLILLLLAAGIYAVGALGDMKRNMDSMKQKLDAVDAEDISAIVDSVRDVTDQMKALDFGDAVESLERAAGLLADVDVESLNGAISSLRDAAGKLSEVDVRTLNAAISSLKDAANTLKALDMESLNALVHTMEQTTEKLQGAVDKAIKLANLFS